MPLYDYLCPDCGKMSELLVTSSVDEPQCTSCGSLNLKRMLSAPSSLSGTAGKGFQGQVTRHVADHRRGWPPGAPVLEAVAGRAPCSLALTQFFSTGSLTRKSGTVPYVAFHVEGAFVSPPSSSTDSAPCRLTATLW